MKIRAIMIEPGKKARTVTISNLMSNFKTKLNCSEVEIVRLGSRMAAVCDAAGRARYGEKVSCLLKGYALVGPVLLVGFFNNQVCSLDYSLTEVRKMPDMTVEDNPEWERPKGK